MNQDEPIPNLASISLGFGNGGRFLDGEIRKSARDSARHGILARFGFSSGRKRERTPRYLFPSFMAMASTFCEDAIVLSVLS